MRCRWRGCCMNLGSKSGLFVRNTSTSASNASASKWHIRNSTSNSELHHPKNKTLVHAATRKKQRLEQQQIAREKHEAKALQIWEWGVQGNDTVAAIDSLFGAEENRGAPIWNTLVSEGLKPVNSYKELQQTLGRNGDLCYSARELECTMLFVATYWINTILVELNVRKVFHDTRQPGVESVPESSLIWRDNLLFNIKDPDRKPELMGLLEQLLDEEFPDETAVENALKETDAQFAVDGEYGHAECFNSLQVLRTFYHNFKMLADYLNYPESDTIAETKSEHFIRFASPQVDSSEYVSRINGAFANYYASADQSQDTCRLELILSLSAILLQGSHFTPSISIFQLILDKLGEAGLLNYQSIVFEALSSSEWSRSLLSTPAISDHIKSDRIAPQYLELIQCNPEFLTSLLSYAAERADEKLFIEFLAFLRLEDTTEHEKVLRRSIFSKVLSRSRFPKPTVLSPHPVAFTSDEPLMVNVDVIYRAIKIACDLNRFEYIDLLINKLLSHLAIDKHTGDLKLILSYGDVNIVDNAKFQIVLGMPKMNPIDFGQYIFTKQLLTLVLNAARRSDDVGRLMWLIPHIDDYLEVAFNDSVEHLNDMDEFLQQFQASTFGTNKYTEFMDKDHKSPIDIAFVNELSKVLGTFGIEGKWSTYNELLDFARVDIEQVAQRNSALELLIPVTTCT